MLTAFAAATIAGLPIGRGEDRGVFGLDLCRPRPCRIALITDLGMAKLLALRALSSGAVVEIITVRPQGWSPVRALAEPGADRLVVRGREERLSPALPDRLPVVTFHDAGVAPQNPPAPRRPNHTMFHVLPGVHTRAAPLLSHCDLVIVAGLVMPQARTLATLLGLGEWAAHEFGSLSAAELCVLSQGRIRRLMVVKSG
jgi:hypothetical protein